MKTMTFWIAYPSADAIANGVEQPVVEYTLQEVLDECAEQAGAHHSLTPEEVKELVYEVFDKPEMRTIKYETEIDLIKGGIMIGLGEED